MSIYVVTHKSLDINLPNGYKTIVVNASNNNVSGDLYDNTGDNISEKNRSYCELTAFYWLWKNSNDDFIGIDHYRRFFVKNNSLLSNEEVKPYVLDGKIILPQKDHFKRRMDIRYVTTSGYKSDLINLRRTIQLLYPSYLKAFDSFMKQYEMHSYNMLVLRKDIFDIYCEWLFSILFEMEKVIIPEKRAGYYQRVFGFLGERLLNVFVMKNNIKIMELPVKYTGEYPGTKQRIQTRVNKFQDKYFRGRA